MLTRAAYLQPPVLCTDLKLRTSDYIDLPELHAASAHQFCGPTMADYNLHRPHRFNTAAAYAAQLQHLLPARAIYA